MNDFETIFDDNFEAILTLLKSYLNIDSTDVDDLLEMAILSTLQKANVILGYKLIRDETVLLWDGNGRTITKLIGVDLAFTKLEYDEFLHGTYKELNDSNYVFYNNNLRLLNGYQFHPAINYKLTYEEGYVNVPEHFQLIIVKASADEFMKSNKGSNRLGKLAQTVNYGGTAQNETYKEYDLQTELLHYQLY